MDKNRVLSVRELNFAAKQLIEEGLPLLWVRGEVSNFVPGTDFQARIQFTHTDTLCEIAECLQRSRKPITVYKDRDPDQQDCTPENDKDEIFCVCCYFMST